MLYVQAVGEKGVKVVSTDSPKSKAFPFTALDELRKKGVRGIFKREDGKLFAVPMTPVKGGGVKYFGKKIAPSEYAGLVWKDTLSSVSQSRFKQYKGVYARGAERPNPFCADSVGVDGSWMPQVTNSAFGTIPCILVSENTGTKSHMLYPERVPSINSYLDAWVENNKVQLVKAHCEYDSELNMFKVPKELHDNFYITLPKSPLQLDGDERASKRLSYYSGNVIMEYTLEDLRRVGLDAKYILCSLDIDKRGNQGVLSCWVTDRGSTELVTLPDIVYDLRAMASQGETNARVRKYYPDIEIRGNTLVMTCMQGTFTFDIDALLQDNTNAMDMGSAGVSGLGKVLTTPVVAGVGTTSIPTGIGMPSVSLLSPDEVTADGTVAVGVVVPVSLSRDGDTITASDGITYRVNDRAGEVYVESAVKSITVANILSEVDGYPVTWIGGEAFIECTSLTSVTIPDGMTFIGGHAFSDCTSLTSVTIGNGVTEICYGAFCNTAYYNDETNWENGVLYIDNCLIRAKISISGDYTIKDGTRLIAEDAFMHCTSLTSVTIPDSVTSINAGAFINTAYYNDETNWENDVLYIDNCLIAARDSVSGDYTIKDGTRLIADYAFWGCTSPTTVTIPDSVTSIGRCAFSGCKSLTSVTIPSSVTSIGGAAFSDTSVKSIRGYRGTEAEKYANKNGFKFVALDDEEITYEVDEEKGVAYVKSASESLTVANIKSEYKGYPVTSIDDSAFYECTSLTAVTIPDSVTSIGEEAFSRCTSLTSVTIPDSVTSIGDWVFCFCTSLTSINVNENNQNYCSENGILFSKGKTELFQYPAGKTDTTYTVPDSVTNIGSWAFGDCASLTSVTIPDGVTNICDGTFEGCTSLTAVTIPDSVTSIGEEAFSRCTSLTSVTIPDSVKSIDVKAFGYVANPKGWGYVEAPDFTIYGYTGTEAEVYANKNGFKFVALDGDEIVYEVDEKKGIAYVKTVGKSITVANIKSEYKGYPVTWIGDDVFKECTSLTAVTIPDSVTIIGDCAFRDCTSLTAVTIPSSVTSIGDHAFRDCTSLTTVTIPSSVTSISGWAFDGCTSLATITIPDSVTSIGWSAFCNCTSLTAVTIPDSVTTIGGWAFVNCTSLTSVTIPDSVTSIDGQAFSNCTSLTTVTIPDSVTSIDDSAFYGCTSLTTVTIGNGVTSIGTSAFWGCTSLTAITIGGSVTSIGDMAFGECTSLTTVTIPDSVTSIDECAFDGCTSLISVTILDSVTSIGNWAFRDCPSLTSVTIPDSVTSIGEDAFSNCKSLTSITIPNSVTSIGEKAFGYVADSEGKLNAKVPDFIIYGYMGTEAETYANKNEIKFVALDGGSSDTDDEIVYGIDEEKGVAYVESASTSLTVANIKSEYKGYRVTSVGENAFYKCKSLTSVTIPDSVKSIGGGAFKDCTSLTSVTIPNSVKRIEDWTFAICTSLTSVTIPSSVTYIGHYVFEDCTSLTSVTIPDSVKSIGETALGYVHPEGKRPIRAPYFTIYGYTGSEAETYAIVNEIKFVALDDGGTEADDRSSDTDVRILIRE